MLRIRIKIFMGGLYWKLVQSFLKSRSTIIGVGEVIVCENRVENKINHLEK